MLSRGTCFQCCVAFRAINPKVLVRSAHCSSRGWVHHRDELYEADRGHSAASKSIIAKTKVTFFHINVATRNAAITGTTVVAVVSRRV